MLNLLLILLGLISNPHNSNNTSNCGGDGTATTTVAQSNPDDTGGDTGQVPPRK